MDGAAATGTGAWPSPDFSNLRLYSLSMAPKALTGRVRSFNPMLWGSFLDYAC